ncbi:MAG: HD domain-containing protein [Saprospiraceae bacterium]|nr:HD domain-containing protein [Saprospiraceae bacterium]
MISHIKIFNDPVYGFVKVPNGIILELIDHPYFQRLSRIKQVGTVSYVYPGATHTRMHHAIGALHLMMQALDILKSKGVAITEEEVEAACIAILLHDIGHGPYSHALEGLIINAHHESITEVYLDALNKEFAGKLSLAIKIFKNEYHKPFLFQLVSGQLDMDRLDYLNRDSFYTGVSEGIVGYDRIIKMLDVRENDLVVEEKGIYSIENFLISRRIMYWQVYLHKTTLSAELMMIHFLKRLKSLCQEGKISSDNNLLFFLKNNFSIDDLKNDSALLKRFSLLDDYDVIYQIKMMLDASDRVLREHADGLLNRKLFKLKYRNNEMESDYITDIRQRILRNYGEELFPYFFFTGTEKNVAYDEQKEIKILNKAGEIISISEIEELDIKSKIITKFYSCFPKNML